MGHVDTASSRCVSETENYVIVVVLAKASHACCLSLNFSVFVCACSFSSLSIFSHLNSVNVGYYYCDKETCNSMYKRIKVNDVDFLLNLIDNNPYVEEYIDEQGQCVNEVEQEEMVNDPVEQDAK